RLDLSGAKVLRADHQELGEFQLHADGAPEFLFCENETNARRLYGQNDHGGWFKDGINDCLIQNDMQAVNPAQTGTKAGVLHKVVVPPGGSHQIRLRLVKGRSSKPFSDFDAVFATRLKEADEFYSELQHGIADAD